MSKTLYVSDLDGTLLSSYTEVSPVSVTLLNRAIGQGALFSVATARTPSTVSVLMREVHANIPFIVMTGAAEWDPLTGLFSNPVTLPPSEAEKILGVIRAHRLPSFVYRLRGNKIDIYHTGPVSERERVFIAERDNSEYKRFFIPPSGESIMPEPLSDVVLFYAMQPAGDVAPAYAELLRECDCNPVFYHDIYSDDLAMMEVFSPDASKANALRRLKAKTGATRVVAFGDNINDIPMLREADVAVAVGNALPEVKAVADVIIGKNTDDAVPKFILEDFAANG